VNWGKLVRDIKAIKQMGVKKIPLCTLRVDEVMSLPEVMWYSLLKTCPHISQSRVLIQNNLTVQGYIYTNEVTNKEKNPTLNHWYNFLSYCDEGHRVKKAPMFLDQKKISKCDLQNV